MVSHFATSQADRSAPNAASDTAPDPVSVDLDDLIALRWQAGAAALQIRRGLTGIPGLIATPVRGQGLEFDDLRIYQEGDDIRYLDWNVTARSGKPHVRLFREERERTLTVALDLGAAMFTGSQQLHAVSACRAAAALMWHTAQTGGRCGVVIHDGTSLTLTRPTPGEQGVLAACAAMSAAYDRARGNAWTQSPFEAAALSALLEWVAGARRDSGLTVLVSSLDQPEEQWTRDMLEAGQSGRLAALWIRDPLTINGLPPGSYRYLSANGPALATLSAAQADSLRQQLQSHADTVDQACRNSSVPLATYAGEDITRLFESIQQAGF